MTFMSCWELFPPSFYRTHTEEEIKEATEKAMKELDLLLEELKEMERKEEGKVKIFLDDTKLCPKGWLWVKTIDDFQNAVQKNIDNLEVISLDYELEATDKGRTGLDACRYLIMNDIYCPKIIIHSIHPKADQMKELMFENMKNTIILMEEYDIHKVMGGYDD